MWGKRARVFETENLRVGFVYGDYKQGMGTFFIYRVYLKQASNECLFKENILKKYLIYTYNMGPQYRFDKNIDNKYL